ncbi:MAG: PAS domain-containing protein [Rubrivivax sp.]|nr:PAS domain-containing protein [Rubrivivax sp.]
MSRTFGDGVLQQVLQATPQGVWFLDARGITVDVNAAMCRLLGREREEVLGRAAPDFFQDAHRTTLQRELAARHRGAAGVYEADIVRADGTVCHCINHATPLFDSEGELVGSVGLWTDLTAQRRNEQALHGYAFAFNSISEAVSVVDPEMRYMMVNDAWCRITGIAREDAVGRVATQLLGTTGYLTDERRLALEGCLREGREARVTSAHVGPDGNRVHLETTHTPYRDAAGELRGAVLTTRNVTAEQHMIAMLQASEARQRALLDAFPGFIAAVDEQMRYTYANDRLAQLLGRPAHEIVGRTAREVLGEARAEAAEQEVRAAFAGRVTRAERHYPASGDLSLSRAAGEATGSRVPGRLALEVLHVSGPPQPDGRRTCFVFGLDVTERLLAQDALRAARDEAEQANRAKSRFLAQMSHELRTPLHAITGFAQLLERDPRAPLTPQQAGFVSEILHGAQHLLELINEVLDLGRIEAGRLQLQPEAVALPALVQECLALVQPLARERDVLLREARFAARVDQTWAVRADRMRLKQVLLNLLANAVKYNHRGGEVDLAVDAVQAVDGGPGGPAVRIAVRDTGPGLDDASVDRLFRPFERLGAEHGAVEGTGIGLALSRRLVLAMGGRIGVDSRPGEGSRFWLELPQAVPGAPATVPYPATPAEPARDVGLAGASVLYVDDNPVNLVLMEAMLRLLPGLRLFSAENAAEGLRLASQERPRLILLDIQLPDMDGFELLARLRAMAAHEAADEGAGAGVGERVSERAGEVANEGASEATATRPTPPMPPVVAVSANAMPADIEAARAAGFADYLTKPLDLERLHATVRRMLALQ